MALPSFGGAGGGKVRMAALDDGGLATPLSLAGHLDVEQFADVRLHADVDAVLGDEALAFGECLGREVLQHLQLVFRLADEGSQRNGDGQTYHAGAGNADTHRVFQEQNKNLAGHVGQLKFLHDSLKRATDEVANIKKSLEILSKDLKDSQELQDTVLDDINKKVEEIPVTGKGYKDEIVAKIDSVETKLDTLQSELSQVNTLCQGIKSSSVELNSLMNSSTKALSNTILQSKEDILKSIKTSRWFLMAGLIIAGILALAALRFIL